MCDACSGHTLPYSCVRTCAIHAQATPCLTAVCVHARCVYRRHLLFSCVRTCVMHAQAIQATPFSCDRTCAMHAQATPCLSAVFGHARYMYRPHPAFQRCSYMRDACTGHPLPVSCVRTCAMHAQATLCLSAVFVHARCMHRPHPALLLSTYMRDACTGPCASARRPAPLKGRACGRRVGCSAKALRLELLREALDVGEVLEEGHAVAAWAVQRGPARRPVGFGDVKGRPCGRRVGCSAKAVRVGPWASAT